MLSLTIIRKSLFLSNEILSFVYSNNKILFMNISNVNILKNIIKVLVKYIDVLFIKTKQGKQNCLPC